MTTVERMENETRTDGIQRSVSKILEEIRIIGAIGEVLQLFEGMGGPVKPEPDCLGVIGALIACRTADVFETVNEIEALLEDPVSGVTPVTPDESLLYPLTPSIHSIRDNKRCHR